MSSRKSTQQAIENYIKRQEKKDAPKRKNAKPEKTVEKDVMAYMKTIGLDMEVIEAKATYSEKTGRYTSKAIAPGYTDSSGNTPDGIAVFVEFKAPFRRNTLRDNQRKFIERKIEMNCFAAVVDSTHCFAQTYRTWKTYRNRGMLDEARDYLISQLPKKRRIKEVDEIPF